MKLIIINGPCGVGKTIVAEKVHDSMPLSFRVDVDAQARFMSHYREYREERWELTFAVTMAIMEACFKLGHDVIVEKMVYDPKTLDQYRALAKKFKAEIHEIILWADKDTVMKRAGDRGWRENSLLTPEKCERFWNQIDELKDKRKDATIIDTSELSIEKVVGEVKKIVSK